MRHPLRLTNSEMKTFKRCRRKWWLSTYRGLGPRQRDFNRPTGIGTRVHNALAVLYDPVAPQDPVAWLKQSVQEDLTKFPDERSNIEKEADLALAMIEGYWEWLEETGADRGFEVVASEGAREAVLYEDVTLLSKLDARIVHRERQDIRLALEHKTVGDLSTPLPFLQIDTQLLTEHLVEYMSLRNEGRDADAAQGVLYNMLRKCKRTSRAKPPFFGREEVKHNRHELEKHWMHVIAVAKRIRQVETELEAGASHHEVCEPNPTRDCKWECPFFHICSHFDDGSNVELDLAADFEVGNPLQRYADTVGGLPGLEI
jgi:hypothetical protein